MHQRECAEQPDQRDQGGAGPDKRQHTEDHRSQTAQGQQPPIAPEGIGSRPCNINSSIHVCFLHFWHSIFFSAADSSSTTNAPSAVIDFHGLVVELFSNGANFYYDVLPSL